MQDSSRNVLIENNNISTGDDHIAIKSGLSDAKHTTARDKYPAFVTRNVTVRKNLMHVGMGVSIGSETSGSIEEILIENNTVGLCAKGDNCNLSSYHPWDPTSGPSCATGMCGWNAGLHVKTTLQRGGRIQGVMFRNNTVSANFSCISLITNYQAPSVLPVGYPATVIRNISFIDNTCGANQVGLHCNANDT